MLGGVLEGAQPPVVVLKGIHRQGLHDGGAMEWGEGRTKTDKCEVAMVAAEAVAVQWVRV